MMNVRLFWMVVSSTITEILNNSIGVKYEDGRTEFTQWKSEIIGTGSG